MRPERFPMNKIIISLSLITSLAACAAAPQQQIEPQPAVHTPAAVVAKAAPKQPVGSVTVEKTATLPTKSLAKNEPKKGFYYADSGKCVGVAIAGDAIPYLPTGKHKAFSDKRIKGLEKRELEGDACVLIAAMPGKRWVFLQQGTWVYTKGTKVVMLAECQNDIYELEYIKSDVQPKFTAVEEQAPTVVTNTTEVQTITQVVQELKVCQAADGRRFDAVNGQCNFAPTIATVSVQSQAKASAEQTQTVQRVAVQSVQAKAVTTTAADCADCNPVLNVVSKVARTDGRCVLKVKDEQGGTSFVLFGLQDGGHVTVVRVTDESGNTRMEQYRSMVGFDENGVKATAKIQNKDCDMAVKAFSDPRALRFVAPRLGFKWCTPVGRV